MMDNWTKIQFIEPISSLSELDKATPFYLMSHKSAFHTNGECRKQQILDVAYRAEIIYDVSQKNCKTNYVLDKRAICNTLNELLASYYLL